MDALAGAIWRQQKGRKGLPNEVRQFAEHYFIQHMRQVLMLALKPNSCQLYFLLASLPEKLPGLSQPWRFLGNKSVNFRKGRARVGIDSELSQSGCGSASVSPSRCNRAKRAAGKTAEGKVTGRTPGMDARG